MYLVKKLLVLLVLPIVVLYILFHLAFYGTIISDCPYTDKILPIPADFQNTIIELEKDKHVIRGKNPDDCSPLLKNIENEILDTSKIYIPNSYYVEKDLTLETFAAGKSFTLEKIVTTTKHGLSAIDEGPDPIVVLILKDTQGNYYKLLPVYGAGFSYSKNGTKTSLPSYYPYFADLTK